MTRDELTALVAALRSEGYEVYRPAECAVVPIVNDASAGETSRWGPSAAAMDSLEHSPPGLYHLVPVVDR